MGWSGPMPNAEGRMVGYAVPATCDDEHCEAKIDRGLAYCCGGMHDGGDHGCGGYFCYEHLLMGNSDQFMCEPCTDAYDDEHRFEDCDGGYTCSSDLHVDGCLSLDHP